MVRADASAVNMDRRLHQLLNEDGEAGSRADQAEAPTPTAVAVQDWGERGYSVVTVSCRDRPKLLFDVVCTLTDLDYVVYHGTFHTDDDRARQVKLLGVSFSVDPQDFFPAITESRAAITELLSR
jgi:UTP:GlnB (protein PII) uridylyltransferase